MPLSSAPFFVFLFLVWLLYWLAATRPRHRVLILAVANLFFLAKFGLLYLALPMAATVDFFVGLALFREGGSIAKRRALLGVSLLVNVGLLLATKLIPMHFGDRYSWLLTLSLSFYCFQSLTYTIDLYRREDDAEPTRNWLAYLAAALFFPCTIAGPILRLHGFLKQLAKPPVLTPELAGRALLLIGIGLVKKLLIADYLSENLVTRVFDTPTLYSGLETLAAVYGYALQLFFDFSGYTDIALGVGLLLGLVLPENFRRPYLSANVGDFWRRWHMSFSFWLRDYLQERLPQNKRKFPLMSYCYTALVTFTLGGLWHGVLWAFLVWGLLHGAALACFGVWRSKRGRRKATRAGTLLGTVVTFHFVCFTWIFFKAASDSDPSSDRLLDGLKAASLQKAWDVLGRFGSLGTRTGWSHDNVTLPILGVLAFAAAAHCMPVKWLDWSGVTLGRLPFWVQGAALAGLVLAIQSLAGQGSAGFIYGAF